MSSGFWILVASLLFAIMGFLVKKASIDISLLNILFYRTLVNLILCFFILKIKKQSIRTQFLKLNLYRAFLGNLAMYCNFYAVTKLPIAAATALMYTNPVFQTLIVFSTSNKKNSYLIFFVISLALLGIYFLLDPHFTDFSGTVIGLLSAILTAFAYFNVKQLISAGESDLRVVFYFSLVGVIISCINQLFSGFYLPSTLQLYLLIGIGISGSFGQISLTKAYGYGNPIIISTLSYSTIIFSTLLGYYFLGEQISFKMSFGILLIITAGIMVILLNKKSNIK